MTPLFQDIVVILGIAVIVTLLFEKLKFPTIIGFLLTGTIAGPHGLSLITASHEVELLAEVGVILLLFIIGIEFSLGDLAKIKKSVFLGGASQVFLTIAAVVAILTSLYWETGHAIFAGCLLALSSTAIVLKLLQEKGEINSPHGKTILGILIFQDIIVVPMMLSVPFLSGKQPITLLPFLLLTLKVVLIIIFVLVAARYIVPNLLYQIAKTKNKELFILSIVVICFSIAWLTSSIGLSLALGAFMAGLIISESEYSHQALGNILPFREIFASFFFVSIGMLLNVKFVIDHIFSILLLTFIVIALKFIISAISGRFLKMPIRSSILVGLGLAQVGEFAFILSNVGVSNGLLDADYYQYFLAISILTMSISPFIIKSGNEISLWIQRFLLPNNISDRYTGMKDYLSKKKIDHFEDHLIIIGYGLNGKNVAKAAKAASIPYVILELNADTVKKEKLKGEHILFGDAVHAPVLEHLNIHKARVAVIAVSDPVATKQIVVNIRNTSKNIHLIVRTRFIQDTELLFSLGANEVIPEEFETSIEIFTRVLTSYLVPRQEIEEFIQEIREDNYEMLRLLPGSTARKNLSLAIPDIEIAAISVQNETFEIVNNKIAESGVRKKFGITIIAIKRKSLLITSIGPDEQIYVNDTIYILGKPEDIYRFSKKLK